MLSDKLLSCDKITMILYYMVDYPPFTISAERFTKPECVEFLCCVFKGSTQICRHFAHWICIIIIQHITFMVKKDFFTHITTSMNLMKCSNIFKKKVMLRAAFKTLWRKKGHDVLLCVGACVWSHFSLPWFPVTVLNWLLTLVVQDFIKSCRIF